MTNISALKVDSLVLKVYWKHFISLYCDNKRFAGNAIESLILVIERLGGLFDGTALAWFLFAFDSVDREKKLDERPCSTYIKTSPSKNSYRNSISKFLTNSNRQ